MALHLLASKLERSCQYYLFQFTDRCCPTLTFCDSLLTVSEGGLGMPYLSIYSQSCFWVVFFELPSSNSPHFSAFHRARVCTILYVSEKCLLDRLHFSSVSFPQQVCPAYERRDSVLPRPGVSHSIKHARNIYIYVPIERTPLVKYHHE